MTSPITRNRLRNQKTEKSMSTSKLMCHRRAHRAPSGATRPRQISTPLDDARPTIVVVTMPVVFQIAARQTDRRNRRKQKWNRNVWLMHVHLAGPSATLL